MKNKGIKLAKKAFQVRPRRFSVMWMLPNFLTICALIFGLQAMYQALFNNWDSVIIMIIIASVFDMLEEELHGYLNQQVNLGCTWIHSQILWFSEPFRRSVFIYGWINLKEIFFGLLLFYSSSVLD